MVRKKSADACVVAVVSLVGDLDMAAIRDIGSTYLPAMIMTRASSSSAAALGEAETSRSLTAFSSHDTTSCGYFSLSQVYKIVLASMLFAIKIIVRRTDLVLLANLASTEREEVRIPSGSSWDGTKDVE